MFEKAKTVHALLDSAATAIDPVLSYSTKIQLLQINRTSQISGLERTKDSSNIMFRKRFRKIPTGTLITYLKYHCNRQQNKK
jgi:hypothetical protein